MPRKPTPTPITGRPKSPEPEKASSPANSAQPASPQLSAWIDELGALETELAPYQAKINRIPALRKLISANCGLTDHESGPLHGDNYTALVSARKFESTINKIKVFAMVGKAAFLRACGLTQKAMEEDLGIPEAERDRLITKQQTGPREVKTYRNPAVIQMQKAA